MSKPSYLYAKIIGAFIHIFLCFAMHMRSLQGNVNYLKNKSCHCEPSWAWRSHKEEQDVSLTLYGINVRGMINPSQ